MGARDQATSVLAVTSAAPMLVTGLTQTANFVFGKFLNGLGNFLVQEFDYCIEVFADAPDVLLVCDRCQHLRIERLEASSLNSVHRGFDERGKGEEISSIGLALILRHPESLSTFVIRAPNDEPWTCGDRHSKT